MGARLLVGLGIVLLLAAMVDVFLTVFSPAAYGGPITRRQNRLLWRAFRLLASRARQRTRDRWLALAAPVMAIATLGLWLLLVIVGFGLIYRPWITTFLVSPGHLRGEWTEALLFSGQTATTLGLGDVVPDLIALRFVSVAEAATGFALVTAVLGYILSISQAGRAMATLALDIAAHFDGENAPEKLMSRMGDAAQASAWGQWSESAARALLQSWVAHTRYPILLYYHPDQRGEALTVQLGSLLRFQRAVRDAPAGTLVRHPGVQALSRAIDWYVLAVDRYFVPGGGGDDRRDGDGGEANPIAVGEAYARLLEHTAYGEQQ